ncbi:MAG: phenylacetate--CoA ligase family protein [Deltaproteobacteria bacterium]|nr:phenylacetate--CoA ligase family protein [Deltaproteobacteria bacterium]
MKEIVKKLPEPVMQPIRYMMGCLPPRFRYGRVFRQSYDFLDNSQWWNKERLQEYQMNRLEQLLHHAYRNVPYYRRVFQEMALRPDSIKDFGDMNKLPFLTKTIIQNNIHDLVAENYPRSRLESVSTGGSTGDPLGFYHERGISAAREKAFIFALWSRVGFKAGDKCVELRGNILQSKKGGTFWMYNPAEKILRLSSYQMTDETLPKYIEKIRQFRPDFFHVYPSSIMILGKFMKERSIRPFHSVKALLCASENIYSWQRELLEDVFQCRVFSFYGHSERAVLAGECEKSISYHISPEYGFTEIVDERGIPVEKDGETGEIVATGFNNQAMPFIRYKTGDIAVYSSKTCTCGRNYPLIERIRGRIQDFLLSRKNHLIPLSTIQYEALGDSNFVRQFQFYQEKAGEVVVNIVKAQDYTKEEERRISRALQKGVSGDIEFHFEYKDLIPRTSGGKRRLLIQKLPSPE